MGQLTWGSERSRGRKTRMAEKSGEMKTSPIPKRKLMNITLTVGQKQKTDEKRVSKVVVLVELNSTKQVQQPGRRGRSRCLTKADGPGHRYLPSGPEHNGSARARSEMSRSENQSWSEFVSQSAAAGLAAPSSGPGGY